jgi:hypothetical protein
MGPRISEIELSMSDWSLDELRAFFCCVRATETVAVPDAREDLVACSNTELFWAYNSRTAAQAKQSADKLKDEDVRPIASKNENKHCEASAHEGVA